LSFLKKIFIKLENSNSNHKNMYLKIRIKDLLIINVINFFVPAIKKFMINVSRNVG
jgi:hypothetical protein